MNITILGSITNKELVSMNNDVLITQYIEDFNNDDEFKQISLNCSICFVKVETSIGKDGSCNSNALDKCIHKIRNIGFKNDPTIFIVSKIPPGTSNELGVHYLPDLNIDTFHLNGKTLVGINYNDPYAEQAMGHIQSYFSILKDNNILKSDKLLFIKNKELELVEITKQAYFATKIAFFSEINEYCNKQEIDYRKIKEYVCFHPQIEDSYNNILGKDNKKGFSGNSMMKNLIFLSNKLQLHNIKSFMINNVIKRNTKSDRKECDWLITPDDDQLDEEIAILKTQTLKDLNTFCENYNIDNSDCVERIDIIEKIIAFKKKNYFNIPILQEDVIPSNIVPTAFNVRQTVNPNSVPNNTTTNTDPNSFKPPSIHGQSGIPMQINQPPAQRNNPQQNRRQGGNPQVNQNMFRPGGRNMLNMNVRSNNGMSWGTTRPGTRGGGAGGGGVRFGGGVQR